MKHLHYTPFVMILLVMATACSPNAGDTTLDHEPPTIAVTQWTEKMELFMEYPSMVVDTPGKFVIHLTELDDFRAVNEGSVSLSFTHVSGQQFDFKQDQLLRMGIFNPSLSLPLAGKYTFKLTYTGPNTSDTFRIPDFEVLPSGTHFSDHEEEEDGGITYLKEQQWNTSFATVKVVPRPIRESIRVTGEVLPRQGGFVMITSPVQGLYDASGDNTMMIPGRKVRSNQTVAVIAPSLSTDVSWAARKNAFENAVAEYDRAKRLYNQGAIPEREFQRIQNTYEVQKSGYEEALSSTDTDLFTIKTPIAGEIGEVFVHPGEQVVPGQQVMTVVEPSRVWLRLNVFEKDYYGLEDIRDASIIIPGLEASIYIAPEDFRLLSRGSLLDPESQSIPVYIEVVNVGRKLKIGQTVGVQLYLNTAHQLPAIPASAVLEEGGEAIVFVHTEGESFEKRLVSLGGQENGWIGVAAGISVGERVVTAGAYAVKLASTSETIGHPHSH